MLWACLATMAAYAKDLNTAETAYAAIDEVRYNTFQQFCLQKTVDERATLWEPLKFPFIYLFIYHPF